MKRGILGTHAKNCETNAPATKQLLTRVLIKLDTEQNSIDVLRCTEENKNKTNLQNQLSCASLCVCFKRACRRVWHTSTSRTVCLHAHTPAVRNIETNVRPIANQIIGVTRENSTVTHIHGKVTQRSRDTYMKERNESKRKREKKVGNREREREKRGQQQECHGAEE